MLLGALMRGKGEGPQDRKSQNTTDPMLLLEGILGSKYWKSFLVFPPIIKKVIRLLPILMVPLNIRSEPKTFQILRDGFLWWMSLGRFPHNEGQGQLYTEWEGGKGKGGGTWGGHLIGDHPIINHKLGKLNWGRGKGKGKAQNHLYTESSQRHNQRHPTKSSVLCATKLAFLILKENFLRSHQNSIRINIFPFFCITIDQGIMSVFSKFTSIELQVFH